MHFKASPLTLKQFFSIHFPFMSDIYSSAAFEVIKSYHNRFQQTVQRDSHFFINIKAQSQGL